MTLKTAVVGGGAVSAVHLSGLKANPNVDLRAVCDANEVRAGDRATEYDVRAYGDFEGMLALEDLDWVHVCTPVDTHVELARMALEDDLALQIESPLTDGASRAESLAAMVADRDTRVSVVHDGAFEPAMIEATERVREGTIGPVRAVDLLYTGEPSPDEVDGREWVEALAGGAFEERLARPVSQVLRLGGYPESVDAISARATRRHVYEEGYTFDGATFQYTTAGGVHCSGTVVASDVPQRVIRVHGDQGWLLVDLEDDTTVHRDWQRAGERKTDADASPSAVERLRGVAARVGRVVGGSADERSASSDRLDGRIEQIDREARALVADEPLPVPLSEGVWVTHVCQAIRDAAGTPEPVVHVAPEMDPA